MASAAPPSAPRLPAWHRRLSLRGRRDAQSGRCAIAEVARAAEPLSVPAPRGIHWPGVQKLLAVPNLLSLVRLPLGLLLWLDPKNPWFLFWVGLAAALTDMIDGAAARHLPARFGGRRGDEAADAGGIGSWLDPVCDKLFVLQALIVVVVVYHPPLWAMAALLFRDVAQAMLLIGYGLVKGREATDRIDYHANRWGKATTVTQFLALAGIVFGVEQAVWLAWGAGALGVAAVTTMIVRVLSGAGRIDAPGRV